MPIGKIFYCGKFSPGLLDFLIIPLSYTHALSRCKMFKETYTQKCHTKCESYMLKNQGGWMFLQFCWPALILAMLFIHFNMQEQAIWNKLPIHHSKRKIIHILAAAEFGKHKWILPLVKISEWITPHLWMC